MNDNNKSDKLTKVLLIIYMIVLFWIVILKFNVAFSYGYLRTINLIPYYPLILKANLGFGEMIMNVLIFVPLGLYSGVLFRNWGFGKKILLVLLTSLICEIIQYILAVGTADITDLINNTLGGLIGLALYKGIEKAFGKRVKAQKFINVIALVGTISMVLFLALLKLDALWLLGINFKYR